MDLRVPYTLSHLMVIWTQNFFMVSSTSSLSHKHRTSKVQNFSYFLVMAPTFQLIQSTCAEEKTFTCTACHHTPVFQPLDVVIFHPLKAHFNRITQNLKLATLGWKESINCCKTNFTKLFKQLWELMTVTLIKTGFWKCGIFPLDRSAIDSSRLSGNSSNPPPTSSNL